MNHRQHTENAVLCSGENIVHELKLILNLILKYIT